MPKQTWKEEEKQQEIEDALSDPDEINQTMEEFFDCDEIDISNFNDVQDLNSYIPTRKISIDNDEPANRGAEFNSCIDNQLQGLANGVGMQHMLETIQAKSKRNSFDEAENKQEQQAEKQASNASSPHPLQRKQHLTMRTIPSVSKECCMDKAKNFKPIDYDDDYRDP